MLGLIKNFGSRILITIYKVLYLYTFIYLSKEYASSLPFAPKTTYVYKSRYRTYTSLLIISLLGTNKWVDRIAGNIIFV